MNGWGDPDDVVEKGEWSFEKYLKWSFIAAVVFAAWVMCGLTVFFAVILAQELGLL